jgi:hypothetical protein
VNDRTRRVRVNHRVHRSIHYSHIGRTYPVGYVEEHEKYEVLLSCFELFIDHLMTQALAKVAVPVYNHNHLDTGDAVLVTGDAAYLDQVRRGTMCRVKTLALCLNRTCLNPDTRRLIIAVANSSVNDIRYIEADVNMIVPPRVGILCADEITYACHENEFGAYITFKGVMKLSDVNAPPVIPISTPPPCLSRLLQKTCETGLVCTVFVTGFLCILWVTVLIARACCD